MTTIEREQLVLKSMLAQAEALRKEVEKRVKPLIDHACSGCQFCNACESAIEYATQTETAIQWALENCVDDDGPVKAPIVLMKELGRRI